MSMKVYSYFDESVVNRIYRVYNVDYLKGPLIN